MGDELAGMWTGEADSDSHGAALTLQLGIAGRTARYISHTLMNLYMTAISREHRASLILVLYSVLSSLLLYTLKCQRKCMIQTT